MSLVAVEKRVLRGNALGKARKGNGKGKITVAVPFRNRRVPYYTHEHVRKNMYATATSALACCEDCHANPLKFHECVKNRK